MMASSFNDVKDHWQEWIANRVVGSPDSGQRSSLEIRLKKFAAKKYVIAMALPRLPKSKLRDFGAICLNFEFGKLPKPCQ
jgi:hypothetical protein